MIGHLNNILIISIPFLTQKQNFIMTHCLNQDKVNIISNKIITFYFFLLNLMLEP